MRVLHAWNLHRGGGGANNATRATIDLSVRRGIEVEVFSRDSNEVPGGIGGRIRAGLDVLRRGESVEAFRQTLDRFRPDLVHIHEIFPLISPWILPLCTERAIPVVMSCVDYRLTCPTVTHLRHGEICTRCVGGHEGWAIARNCRENLAESVLMSLYSRMHRRNRLFLDHVTRFIAPSAFTRNWLIRNGGIEPSRITAISPPVEIPDAPADPGAGGYVAYAGRFSPEKGIDTAIAAMRLVEAPFRFARNEKSLVVHPLPEDLDVVVTRGRYDLSEFYRQARMVVVPSLWFETFGLVGAEAMSHGIPVVVSRIGAVEELVTEGVDGFHFEPGDARDLADKVRTIWNDPDLCRRMGTNARRKAVESWGEDRHMERIAAVYDQVLGERSPIQPIPPATGPVEETS